MVTAKKFDKDYFHGKNYDYSENSSFYDKVNWDSLAKTMLSKYKQITGLTCDSFFDVGCAKGYLVKAFLKKGVEARGIDISKFAISEAPAEAKPFVRQGSVTDITNKDLVEFVSAFGVLHYLTAKQVEEFIAKCAKNVTVLNIGQFPLGDDEKTRKAWAESDAYTKLFKPFPWWIDLLNKHGFAVIDTEWHPKTEEINLYALNKLAI